MAFSKASSESFLRRAIEAVVKKGKQWLRWASTLLVCGVLSLVLFGCGNRSQPVRLLEPPDVPSGRDVRPLTNERGGAISEVAPPAIFLDLNELMTSVYSTGSPQVEIAEPKAEQIIDNTFLSVKIRLRGLSIYKSDATGLGPHLAVTLDHQPARMVYSLDDPIEFSELAPGSHTLQVLVLKPWGESFKSETAYAQTTFHVLAETGDNSPDPSQASLIYNQPQGTYGAEPILLDFYLHNVPLHLVAAEEPTVSDWKIRCDINGQSFVLDQWRPMYLKGFKTGKNWVRLTLIDEQGEPIRNTFNSTVRIINYEPTQRDALAKMTRGELLLKDVGQMVDPNYEPPTEPIVPVEPAVPDPIELPSIQDAKDLGESEPEDAIESEEPLVPSMEAPAEETTQPEIKSERSLNAEQTDDPTKEPKTQEPVEPDGEIQPELPETTKLPVDEPAVHRSSSFSNFDQFAAERDTERAAREALEELPEGNRATNNVVAPEPEIIEDEPEATENEPKALEDESEVNRNGQEVIEDAPQAIEDAPQAIEDTTDIEKAIEDVPTPNREADPVLDAPSALPPSLQGDVTESQPVSEGEESFDDELSSTEPGLFERLQTFWQQLNAAPPTSQNTTDVAPNNRKALLQPRPTDEVTLSPESQPSASDDSIVNPESDPDPNIDTYPNVEGLNQAESTPDALTELVPLRD